MMTKKDERNKMKEFFNFLKEWMFSHSTDLNEFDLEGLPFSNFQNLLDNPSDSFFYARREMVSPDGERKITEWGSPLDSIGSPELNNRDSASIQMEKDPEIYSDIIEEEDRFRILIDIRGRNPDQILFDVSEDTITIKQHQQELTKIRLPSTIKPSIEKKDIHNGIITIEVEKMKG
jgi:HSP20 family molecular chaperone IbpA